ncbi:Uncharacterised protein [BD1-7 clade bacterium]|uniref:Immunity protein 45 domain-containing protein n=1 Tax=BD1-7 clade bacterium TaxID=2029982 RepID=A0A5S9Q9D6_9GAMM|nr:Uncharacterised protein [BD1-7 clade bacterium]
MNWIALPLLADKQIFRGAVFRFSGKHPFEDVVDFMLIDEGDSDIGLKLICSTGYHAGQTELILPKESGYENGGLSLDWLLANWEKWVYPECSVNDVLVIDGYPSNF